MTVTPAGDVIRGNTESGPGSESRAPAGPPASPRSGPDIDAILGQVVAGTAATIGEEFFRALVQHLAGALGVRWAFVSEFAGSRARVRTLAFWSRDGFLDDVEYDLPGTPCEKVLGGETCLYSTGVAARFPEEKELEEMGAESYLAMPLIDSHSEVMGHLAVIDDKPFYDRPVEMSVFRIFGTRVAAELERRRMDRALRRSEARLSAILGSALDAIVTIDEGRHITLFNRAAEKVFGCSRAWAVGQPFDRFLSKPFRKLLDGCLRAPATGEGDTERQIWAPEGLVALRADGREFPVEVTISQSEVDGECLYTAILRDVNERRAAEARLRSLELETEQLKEEIRLAHDAGDMVSASGAMRAVMTAVGRVAATDSTVLIVGETGVGKELVARAVHAQSRRADRPLVKLNCAALPSELIESELFGHEKGAFTGASARRIGKFELANRGTLFLDEVGELTPAAQVKLLRVLQEREFERVGGNQTIRTDVRVIAATNRDLAKMAEKGIFRSDLYFRLHVFPIVVPPLRERPEEIPLLVHHFLGRLRRRLGKPLEGIAPTCLRKLQGYAWPGNIRELQNVIERAAILAEGPMVEVKDPLVGWGGVTPARTASGRSHRGAERDHILRVLEETGWTVEGPQGAAALLGLAASTLRSKMKRLGVSRRDGAEEQRTSEDA